MENVICENGENFLIKKKFAEKFLNECLENIVKNNDYDELEIEYFKKENQSLFEELKQFDDEEIICFGECAMSGYLAIYQDRVQDYLDLMKEREENLIMKADFEKVKRAYEKLKEIQEDYGYREFEIAYLILERLDNVIDDEVNITNEVVERVNEIADNVDTLLDSYINEELDNLEKELNREV